MESEVDTTAGASFTMEEGYGIAMSVCENNHIQSIEHAAAELDFLCETNEDSQDELEHKRHFELLNKQGEHLYQIDIAPSPFSKENEEDGKRLASYEIDIHGDEHNLEKSVVSLEVIIKHLMDPELEPLLNGKV